MTKPLAIDLYCGLGGWTEGLLAEGYDPAHPERLLELNALFDAPARIQREASAAAGRAIPMVQENVKGAQPWVGRARWHFGSYYLWGDVPALMPTPTTGSGTKAAGQNWSRFGETGTVSPHWRLEGAKNAGGSWFNQGHPQAEQSKNPVHEAVKQAGLSGPRANGKGDRWFQDGAASVGSKSSARRAASAHIAKIPLALARHIAHVYHPR